MSDNNKKKKTRGISKSNAEKMMALVSQEKKDINANETSPKLDVKSS